MEWAKKGPLGLISRLTLDKTTLINFSYWFILVHVADSIFFQDFDLPQETLAKTVYLLIHLLNAVVPLFFTSWKSFLSLKYMLNSIACCVIVNVIIHNDSEWNLCRFGWLSRNFMSNSVEFATCYQCHLTCYVLYLSPKTRLQLFLAANNLCLHHFWVLI